jgi:hypothetical protein
MNPRGAAPLVAMRESGTRPAGFVFVSYGDLPDPDWWRWANTLGHPQILVRPTDPIERLDLRCLVGLNVILDFAEWSPGVARLYERLTEYAQEIAVESPAFEADIGWWWVRGVGRIGFDDRRHLTAIADAQADAVHAALKRDSGAYQAAQDNERSATEAMSWQP